MALLTVPYQRPDTTIQAQIIRNAYRDILQEQSARSSIIAQAQANNQANLRRMDSAARSVQQAMSDAARLRQRDEEFAANQDLAERKFGLLEAEHGYKIDAYKDADELRDYKLGRLKSTEGLQDDVLRARAEGYRSGGRSSSSGGGINIDLPAYDTALDKLYGPGTFIGEDSLFPAGDEGQTGDPGDPGEPGINDPPAMEGSPFGGLAKAAIGAVGRQAGPHFRKEQADKDNYLNMIGTTYGIALGHPQRSVTPAMRRKVESLPREDQLVVQGIARQWSEKISGGKIEAGEFAMGFPEIPEVVEKETPRAGVFSLRERAVSELAGNQNIFVREDDKDVLTPEGKVAILNTAIKTARDAGYDIDSDEGVAFIKDLRDELEKNLQPYEVEGAKKAAPAAPSAVGQLWPSKTGATSATKLPSQPGAAQPSRDPVSESRRAMDELRRRGAGL